MRHLIHIGYPKAGSTFLQQCFEQHPLMLYKNFAMGGFYSIQSLPETVARHQSKPFAYAVTSSEVISIGKAVIAAEADQYRKIGSDVSRRYLDASYFSNFLSSHFPGAVVLIITRGFASKAISTYKEAITAGYVADFTLSLSDQVKISHMLSDYDGTISDYRKAFGHENVIVLPYELLRDDSARFLRVLQEKLDLEEGFSNPGKINESRTDGELYWLLLANRWLMATTRLLGEKLHRKLYSKHIELMRHGRYRPLFSLLQRLFPNKKLEIGTVPADFLAAHRGLALSLKDLEEYRDYGAEYLLE